MKKIIIILTIFTGFILSGTVANAQSKREQKRTERAERKRAEAEQQEQNQKRMLSLIKKKNFVLEANTLYDKRQNLYPVSSNTNFVAVNGNHATIQIGFPGAIGRNGVGGITIDGNIVSYEVNQNKKGAISVFAQISSATLGNSTLNLQVYGNGTARASVRGNFGSQITFAGNLLSPAEASVYKGTPDF